MFRNHYADFKTWLDELTRLVRRVFSHIDCLSAKIEHLTERVETIMSDRAALDTALTAAVQTTEKLGQIVLSLIAKIDDSPAEINYDNELAQLKELQDSQNATFDAATAAIASPDVPQPDPSSGTGNPATGSTTVDGSTSSGSTTLSGAGSGSATSSGSTGEPVPTV